MFKHFKSSITITYFGTVYRLINLTNVNHFKGEMLSIIKLIEIGPNKFDRPIVSARLILLTVFGISLFLFLRNLNPIYFTIHFQSLAAVLYFISTYMCK